MQDLKLTELTAMGDFLALGAVRVKPEQRRFARSLIMTYMQTRHPAVTTYSVKVKDELVGYVMLIHAENPTQWIIERLTINGAHQRRGLAYAVTDKLIDMVHDFENSEMIIARYKPENEAARDLFAKLNFVEREEMFRGRQVAILEFEFEEDEADEEDIDDEFDDEEEDIDDDEFEDDDDDWDEDDEDWDDEDWDDEDWDDEDEDDEDDEDDD